MITYKNISTKFTIDPDGVQDRVTFVKWNASSVAESVEGSILGRGTPIPADYAPADKKYADVTEQDCIDWVTDLEDQVSIQAQLDAVIAKIETPTEGQGIPWQESYPLWAVGVSVAIGYICTYKSVGYECIQAHTTQSTWAPPATPALWKSYTPGSEGPQPWVQPVGSEDAYGIEAVVTHNGNLWTSLVDANVWEPTPANSTLWLDNGPYP